MKSENHKICQDVMISYVEAVVKIWEDFAQVVTYDASNFTGSVSTLRFFFEMLRFRWIVGDNLCETFSIFHHSLHVWYHDILTNFMIFELRVLFIEF
jgi:hypothetical protein